MKTLTDMFILKMTEESLLCLRSCNMLYFPTRLIFQSVINTLTSSNSSLFLLFAFFLLKFCAFDLHPLMPFFCLKLLLGLPLDEVDDRFFAIRGNRSYKSRNFLKEISEQTNENCENLENLHMFVRHTFYSSRARSKQNSGYCVTCRFWLVKTIAT